MVLLDYIYHDDKNECKRMSTLKCQNKTDSKLSKTKNGFIKGRVYELRKTAATVSTTRLKYFHFNSTFLKLTAN